MNCAFKSCTKLGSWKCPHQCEGYYCENHATKHHQQHQRESFSSIESKVLKKPPSKLSLRDRLQFKPFSPPLPLMPASLPYSFVDPNLNNKNSIISPIFPSIHFGQQHSPFRINLPVHHPYPRNDGTSLHPGISHFNEHPSLMTLPTRPLRNSSSSLLVDEDDLLQSSLGDSCDYISPEVESGIHKANELNTIPLQPDRSFSYSLSTSTPEKIRSTIEIIHTDFRSMLKDKNTHDQMRWLNTKRKIVKLNQETLNNNSQSGTKHFAAWLCWVNSESFHQKRFSMTLSRAEQWKEGQMIFRHIRRVIQETESSAKPQRNCGVQAYCEAMQRGDYEKDLKFTTAVRERIRPVFQTILNWFKNCREYGRESGQIFNIEEQKEDKSDELFAKRLELELKQLKSACRIDKSRQGECRNDAIQSFGRDQNALIKQLDELAKFILTFQAALATEIENRHPELQIQWPSYLTAAQTPSASSSSSDPGSCTINPMSHREIFPSEDPLEGALFLLSLALGGGICFPLRSGAVRALSLSPSSFSIQAGKPVLKVSASNGHQKGHSIEEVFWPEFSNPFFLKMHQVLTEKGNKILHKYAHKVNISRYFSFLQKKYGITIPDILIADLRTDDPERQQLKPKYLRRAFATLSSAMYYRRIFQVRTTYIGHIQSVEPVHLLFAVNVMMAHTFTQAQTFAYNVLPKMRDIWDVLKPTSQKHAYICEKEFWMTDSGGTRAKNSRNLLFLASQAWSCLSFWLDSLHQPICHYCGQLFGGSENQSFNCHKQCYESVMTFFVKRNRFQGLQSNNNSQVLLQSAPPVSSALHVCEGFDDADFSTLQAVDPSENGPKQTQLEKNKKRLRSKISLTSKTRKEEPRRSSDKRKYQKNRRTSHAVSASKEREIRSQSEYRVEKILDKRIDAHGKVFYQVKWQGYPISASTWEPTQNLTNCRQLIDQYEKLELLIDQTIEEASVLSSPKKIYPTTLSINKSLQVRKQSRVILDEEE